MKGLQTFHFLNRHTYSDISKFMHRFLPMWDLQSLSYVHFLMSKSNHGCHVQFKMSCSLSALHPLPPEPVRSLAEDKQMPANLVLVLTVLAATKALMLDFLGDVPPTNH